MPRGPAESVAGYVVHLHGPMKHSKRVFIYNLCVFVQHVSRSIGGEHDVWNRLEDLKRWTDEYIYIYIYIYMNR